MIFLDTKFHMRCCHFLLTISPIHHVLTDNYKNLNRTDLIGASVTFIKLQWMKLWCKQTQIMAILCV